MIAVTLVLLVALREIILHTRFGLALRALSQNRDAAALMGVNSNAVISLTFAIGSALAGAAGVLYAMNIHSIEPLMGTLPGIKAFVAAVLGGIGSLPGAAVGGLLLGLLPRCDRLWDPDRHPADTPLGPFWKFRDGEGVSGHFFPSTSR